MDIENKASTGSGTRESLVEMSRLNNLSDGVFAIALTLLAFDIRLPAEAQVGNLPNGLLKLAPKFAVYLISFLVIGGAWGAHQRMLSQIKRGDGVLVWFNLFCLLFVGLLPAAAALLGRYPKAFLAITCFTLDVALIQITTLWLWRHASRQGLINPMLDPRVVKSIGRRLILSAVIFVISIPLALWNTWITYLCWVGLFILLFTTDWLAWQPGPSKPHFHWIMQSAPIFMCSIKKVICGSIPKPRKIFYWMESLALDWKVRWIEKGMQRTSN